MCMNRSMEETKKYDVLGRYAVAILKGQLLEEVAKQEGMTVDEMRAKLGEIDEVNPPLCKQIQEKLAENDA